MLPAIEVAPYKLCVNSFTEQHKPGNKPGLWGFNDFKDA